MQNWSQLNKAVVNGKTGTSWREIRMLGCSRKQGSDLIYHPPPPVHTGTIIPINAQIFLTCSSWSRNNGGSVFVSVLFPSKTGLVTTAWDRLFFFTQGGNLMCQPRGAVAGGMVLDLDNSSVMAVDCEDRRYCFQITSPSGKTCASSSAG